MSVTAMITPWYRRRGARRGSGATQAGSTAATGILNHDAPAIVALVMRARRVAASDDRLAVLAAAHGIISSEVRAVYALEETTPASRTWERGFGSCSQRLAILESVARAIGVPTRVRGLSIDRSFWYPRFPRIGFALPDTIMLAWPEFRVDEFRVDGFRVDDWRAASELFGPIGCHGGAAFTNRGSETLFEAAGRCAVDWDGRSTNATYDLSRFVRADHGYFKSRDELFAALGQTLCAPSRAVADPVLRRIAA